MRPALASMQRRQRRRQYESAPPPKAPAAVLPLLHHGGRQRGQCAGAGAPPCVCSAAPACPPTDAPPAAQVIVRCRPLNERERREGRREAVRVEGKAVTVREARTLLCCRPPRPALPPNLQPCLAQVSSASEGEKAFTFDQVGGAAAASYAAAMLAAGIAPASVLHTTASIDGIVASTHSPLPICIRTDRRLGRTRGRRTYMRPRRPRWWMPCCRASTPPCLPMARRAAARWAAGRYAPAEGLQTQRAAGAGCSLGACSPAAFRPRCRLGLLQRPPVCLATQRKACSDCHILPMPARDPPEQAAALPLQTHTMEGREAPAEERGIIPRAFDHIFREIQKGGWRS